MAYEVLIKRQAKKKLQSLSRTDRLRLTGKIELLGEDPDNEELDVKPLVGQPYYRMRVGHWRVIFDKQDELKIIAIERIKPRGDVYQ